MSGDPTIAWRFRGLVFAVVLACLAVMGTGCSRTKAYKLNPVRGRVLLENNPVTGGTIRFVNPADPNVVATSPIASDGTFSLQSRTMGATRGSDAGPEGTYQVVISMPPPAPNRPFPSITAPESITVKEGDNEITVELP